jgi:hypothetical protein
MKLTTTPNITRGPIPGSTGFLHILLAFLSFILPIFGDLLYILKVNVENHVVELLFLSIFSGILLWISGTNLYRTYYHLNNASRSFWLSLGVIAAYMLVYIWYILSMKKEQEK